jgi:putative two-component system response regulator
MIAGDKTAPAVRLELSEQLGFVDDGLGWRPLSVDALLDAGNLLENLGNPEPGMQSVRADLLEAMGCFHSGVPLARRVAEKAIEAMLRAIAQWDHATGTHVERMSRYAGLIAAGAGFDEERCALIRLAAQMHDLGKIGLPDGILFKPGRLSPAEFDVVKAHTVRGAEILKGCDTAVLDTAAVIARTHHERWDGGGYPDGLAGREIPIEGRIAAVADVFDALVSQRVYKPAYTNEQALGALNEGRGHHFDADLVDVFVASMDRVAEIQRRYSDL